MGLQSVCVGESVYQIESEITVFAVKRLVGLLKQKLLYYSSLNVDGIHSCMTPVPLKQKRLKSKLAGLKDTFSDRGDSVNKPRSVLALFRTPPRNALWAPQHQ
jgi:hypothetical protein